MMDSSVGDPWRATVCLHLRIRVATERQAEFRSFLREAIPFYEAPGGIRVRLLSKDTEPEQFIEQVEYVDERSYQEDDERTRSDPPWRRSLHDGGPCSLSLRLWRSIARRH
ncbi:MAG: hypothetical protein ACLP41_15330 [Acidimicrobiales bacterium]